MDDEKEQKYDAGTTCRGFVRFMADNGVLKFGEFKLQSGRLSPYYINTANYNSASQITKLGRFYAECMIEKNVHSDVLFGNVNKEISLLIATSIVLFEKYGQDIAYSIGNVEDLAKSKSITIIDNTLTSGKTICETLSSIRMVAKDSVINVVVAVDRMEINEKSPLTAAQYITKEFDAKVYSIVTLQDIMGTIERGVVSGADYLENLLQYREEYGGR